jgi:uncharacterized phiE125 gp8 family phage protein
MSLRLITAPTEYPVTRVEAKQHCRVDGTEEDGLIDTYIAAATAHVEAVTGRAIMDQTWELVLDDFSDAILLPKGPVQSITSITYYDTNSALQTLASDQYTLDNVSDPSWIVRPDDVTYPDVADGVNNVIIRFVAGYSDVPQTLKAALMILIAYFYDNRSTGEIPEVVNTLLTNDRSFAF